jgi:predicted nucleotidyltransferase
MPETLSSSIEPLWAVTPEKVEGVVRRLAALARPRRIILFGSYAKSRGEGSAPNDLDILVIAKGVVEDPYSESVRLRRALSDIVMPMDILVAGESEWEILSRIPGLVFEQAAAHGRIVYESDG